jgi:hypothetical protein
VVCRSGVGGTGKREDEGRRCGQEFGAECMCTAWYEMMEKNMASWRLGRGWRGLCGDARGERYHCVFVLSDRVLWWDQTSRFQEELGCQV